jgi:AcrR family transcriptional regulator
MKSDDRRNALIDQLADYVLEAGLPASSLRSLAKAGGVSDRMLLYYFKDKAEITTAVLARIAERLVSYLNARTSPTPLPLAELRRQLAATLFTPEIWPYMRIWLEVASKSARGEALYRSVGEQLGRGFLEWGAAQLDCANEKERARHAAALLVTIEGMLFLHSIGMSDMCEVHLDS